LLACSVSVEHAGIGDASFARLLPATSASYLRRLCHHNFFAYRGNRRRRSRASGAPVRRWTVGGVVRHSCAHLVQQREHPGEIESEGRRWRRAAGEMCASTSRSGKAAKRCCACCASPHIASAAIKASSAINSINRRRKAAENGEES
jgi:hypothetical protein